MPNLPAEIAAKVKELRKLQDADGRFDEVDYWAEILEALPAILDALERAATALEDCHKHHLDPREYSDAE